jgi:hypothetical protein
MSQFYVVNESTEDTFEASGDLQDAIRLARDVARQGQSGDLVSILEGAGKAVRQFVLMPDGTVAEQPIAGKGQLPVPAPDLNRAEATTAPDPAGT